MVHLDELLRRAGVHSAAAANPVVVSVTDRLAHVRKGSLFIGIKGARTNGESLFDQAIEQGAVVVASEDTPSDDLSVPHVPLHSARRDLARLAAAFYENPSIDLSLVGITGTNGKTTTTFILESILRAHGQPAAVLGTIHYKTGDAAGRPAGLTTPAAVELQELLAEARDSGKKSVVMEVSSHALAQDRVHAIDYDVACYTNITHDHLDFHGDMANYVEAKAKLLRHLKRWGTVVLNLDDANLRRLRPQIPKDAKVIWYSVKPGEKADLTVSLQRMDADGTAFMLHTPKGSMAVTTLLMGGHNISNSLAAVGCALAMGVSLSTIRAGLGKLTGVPGRLERVEVSGGVTAVVDYAHTPDAMRRVLAHVRPMVSGRLFTVFGCGGDRDRTKRPLMGRAASDWSDEVVLTTDNPRSEDPSRIVSDILAGMGGNVMLSHNVDRGEAIRGALQAARTGDWVVVLGKGHETTLKLSSGPVPFDDREVIRDWERNRPEALVTEGLS